MGNDSFEHADSCGAPERALCACGVLWAADIGMGMLRNGRYVRPATCGVQQLRELGCALGQLVQVAEICICSLEWPLGNALRMCQSPPYSRARVYLARNRADGGAHVLQTAEAGVCESMPRVEAGCAVTWTLLKGGKGRFLEQFEIKR